MQGVEVTRSLSFEVALFAVVIDATLEIAEELKPEAQAKPTSCITASLALQASIAGLSASFSSKSATSKLARRVSFPTPPMPSQELASRRLLLVRIEHP